MKKLKTIPKISDKVTIMLVPVPKKVKPAENKDNDKDPS